MYVGWEAGVGDEGDSWDDRKDRRFYGIPPQFQVKVNRLVDGTYNGAARDQGR